MIRWLSKAASAIVIGVVWCYRTFLRPLLPNVCRFVPSCSEYMIQAVKKHGPIKGAAKGVWRICRCNPFCKGGYDPP